MKFHITFTMSLIIWQLDYKLLRMILDIFLQKFKHK